MKIFISWSKTLSKECAEILRDWVKCTLQSTEPWISTKDIDKGSLWFNEINDQLNDTKVGIVCLTKENKNNPWILFESGALAKGLSTNRVCTFLLDLQPTDLDGPLSQFNHTLPDEEGMKSLLSTINSELGDKKLEERILDQVFETYWPIFKTKFDEIKNNVPEKVDVEPVRSSDDILKEILYTTRNLDKRVRFIERNDNIRKHKYLPKEELSEKIMYLLDKGLHPKEIAMELEGFAPNDFILDFAMSMNKNNKKYVMNKRKYLNEKERDNHEEL